MIALVLAACLAQTDWGDFHPRRALSEEELSKAGEVLARRLRAYRVEELAGLASILGVRRGECAPVVFIEVATTDARGNAVTRSSTWTRLVGEWAVQRPTEGWIQLDGDRLAEALAGMPDEALRGHLLALARKDREAVARAKGQAVHIVAVRCLWVEYEVDGASYEALLAGDEVLETESPANRWAEWRVAEAERLLAAGNIDGANWNALAALIVRPDDAAALAIVRRIQEVRRQVIGQALHERELDDFRFWSYVGLGTGVASLVLIALLAVRRSRRATP